MSKIIGIDLGTTNSCIAYMEGDQVRVLENSEGSRTTPSVVAYNISGDVLVGVTAKRQYVTNAKNTLFAVKRIMGRKYSEVCVFRDKFCFDIVEHTNGDAWVKVLGKNIAPQQVSAEILRKMKKTADDYFGEDVKDAVITVPAYFNDTQRQATKDAGKIAGLNVKRIINEPTAAALAFGLNKNYSSDRKIVVYDLGGGTFDVSVIEIASVESDKQFEVLATNGDTYLGGEDFDNKILAYVLLSFKKENNIVLDSDLLAMQRIKEAVEKAKIELSILKETDISLPYIVSKNGMPVHLNLKLTRSKLESLVSGLVDDTLKPCKVALNDSSLSVDDIDDVILVGGMTRMPLVQSKVMEFFKKKPKKDINPDEAVAIGAAIQGQILSGNRKDILLLDVIPLSLGIETLGGVMSCMIKKNTTIPTKYSQVFSTADDNQSAVTIKVYQGEREFVANNKFLGEFNLEGIKPAPRGVPQIDVVFDIDSNGILNVSAKDKSTNIENKITIKSSSGLSADEINAMVNDANNNAENDLKKKKFVEVKNSYDSIVHDIDSFSNTNKLDDNVCGKINELKKNALVNIENKNTDMLNSNVKCLIDIYSSIKHNTESSNTESSNTESSNTESSNTESQ